MNTKYKIKATENQRWGIYQGDRLLATFGNYEACQLILQYLKQQLSPHDNLKSIFSYQNAIDKNLIVR